MQQWQKKWKNPETGHVIELHPDAAGTQRILAHAGYEPVAADTAPTDRDLSDILTSAQTEALFAAGIDSQDAIRAASDEALLDVNGIGAVTVRKLREALG